MSWNGNSFGYDVLKTGECLNPKPYVYTQHKQQQHPTRSMSEEKR